MRRESGTSTKASGEKKSRPSPLPPPVLKNFPFSTCIRPSATRRRSISREHTLWLASLFPAINRFRRKNRGELVGEERGGRREGGRRPTATGKSGATSFFSSSLRVRRRRVTSVRIFPRTRS